MTQARVSAEAGDGKNWLVYGGNFEAQHFSPLKTITEQNVGGLGLAWSLDIPSRMGLAAQPIVADGVIYLGAPLDVVYAVDAVTGKIRWEFDPHIRINGPWRNSYEGRKNRGVAVWNGKVFVGTGDCRMVAIDAATGKQVWDTPVCDASQTGITGAPRVGNGKVFTGWAGYEYAVRGGVVATDAETGKIAWTFWTAPGDPSKPYESKTVEQIAKTWVGDSWKLGGGNVWDTLTYDAVTNLLFIGTSTTGAAVGDFVDVKASGRRLFANCIIAVNASTGEYVWHYQTSIPHSGAEEFTIVVANMTVDGKERRAVMTIPRDGVLYVLDARTGTEVLAPRGIDGKAITPLKQVNLATVTSALPSQAEMAPHGTTLGHANFPMPWDAQHGLLYIPSYEVGRTAAAGTDDRPAPGKLVAFDPIKGVARWTVTHPLPVNSGAIATAGNVVFQGQASGYFSAYAAGSGKKLWSVNTGSAIQADPATYAVNGEQYVVTPVGMGGGFRLFGRASDSATLESKRGPARLMAFKLGGKAVMPKIEAYIPKVPQPPAQEGTPEQIKDGARVYNKFFCQKCHSPQADGSGAWALGGEVPDLRYMPASAHRRFYSIVLDGSNAERGMPGFAKPAGYPLLKTVMTRKEAEALHAYIVDLQWKAFEKGPRGIRSVED